MPQLDKVTFFSQFFWLCFFYLGFYILMYKYFLPKMSRILKLRKKKMNTSQVSLINLVQENESVRNNFNLIIIKALQTSRKMFHENILRTTNWLHEIVKNTNQTHYQNINKAYIQSVGDTSLTENLSISQASLNLPETLFVHHVLMKLQTTPSTLGQFFKGKYPNKVGTQEKNRKR